MKLKNDPSQFPRLLLALLAICILLLYIVFLMTTVTAAASGAYPITAKMSWDKRFPEQRGVTICRAYRISLRHCWRSIAYGIIRTIWRPVPCRRQVTGNDFCDFTATILIGLPAGMPARATIRERLPDGTGFLTPLGVPHATMRQLSSALPISRNRFDRPMSWAALSR